MDAAPLPPLNAVDTGLAKAAAALAERADTLRASCDPEAPTDVAGLDTELATWEAGLEDLMSTLLAAGADVRLALTKLEQGLRRCSALPNNSTNHGATWPQKGKRELGSAWCGAGSGQLMRARRTLARLFDCSRLPCGQQDDAPGMALSLRLPARHRWDRVFLPDPLTTQGTPAAAGRRITTTTRVTTVNGTTKPSMTPEKTCSASCCCAARIR